MSEEPDWRRPSFVWDEQHQVINKTWVDFKRSIESTYGGIGIAAEDFVELLEYYPGGLGETRQNRRNQFSRLVRGARGMEDLDLLARIISTMFINFRFIEAGWAIIYIDREEDENTDFERGAEVINRLYSINPLHTKEFIGVLQENWMDDDGTTVVDRLRATGKLHKEVLRMTQPVSVFISYAREDQEQAERLRSELQKRGFLPWKDTHEILPGENFEQKIRNALEKADCAIICFSTKSVVKTGFVQVEVKEALRLQKYRPDTKIYIMPVRFDKCELPFEIHRLQLHYTDLFPDWEDGINRISAAITRYFSPTFSE